MRKAVITYLEKLLIGSIHLVLLICKSKPFMNVESDEIIHMNQQI